VSDQSEREPGDGNGDQRLAGQGEEKLQGESNYLMGNDPKMWRTHVPHFARTEAAGVARGVNVAVYGNDASVEYDLRIAPGWRDGRQHSRWR
jgi:hypothetical protein